MQLHFKDYGAGQPLIILHGLFGSLDNWHFHSSQLAEHFRVLALDQRNHGHSPHCEEMGYPLMAADLAEFIEREHLPPVHVLGHSMGGKTAMQFALNYPEKTARLIVVDIAPRAYAPRHEQILEAMLRVAPATFHTRSQILQALEPQIPDLALRQFLLKNIQSDSAGVLSWRIGLREIRRNQDRLREEVKGDAPFPGPCLFVRGESSDFLMETDWPQIQRLFPHARLVTIARAGHWVQVQNREAFLKAVRGFLSE